MPTHDENIEDQLVVVVEHLGVAGVEDTVEGEVDVVDALGGDDDVASFEEAVELVVAAAVVVDA